MFTQMDARLFLILGFIFDIYSGTSEPEKDQAGRGGRMLKGTDKTLNMLIKVIIREFRVPDFVILKCQSWFCNH